MLVCSKFPTQLVILPLSTSSQSHLAFCQLIISLLFFFFFFFPEPCVNLFSPSLFLSSSLSLSINLQRQFTASTTTTTTTFSFVWQPVFTCLFCRVFNYYLTTFFLTFSLCFSLTFFSLLQIYVGGLVNLYLGFSAISLGVLLATYCTCSTKLQTKHVCLPVRRRARTGARAKISGDDKIRKSGSRRRLLGGSFLGRSKKSGATLASSAAVNGNGQVTPSSASNHFFHNYVPLSREEKEKEEAEDVSINLWQFILFHFIWLFFVCPSRSVCMSVSVDCQLSFVNSLSLSLSLARSFFSTCQN